MSPDTCWPTEAQAAQETRSAKTNHLWKCYSKTDPGSLTENELVREYLPLVKSAVGRLSMTLPPSVSADDLHSAGLVGLLSAIRRYDPATGVPFESYARMRIRGAIFDELRRLNWIPRSVREKAAKIEEAIREVERKKGELGSDVEVARALNISVEEYYQWLAEVRPATFICLDSARGLEGGDGVPQHERVVDPKQPDPGETTARRELAKLITERLAHLPEAQRKVLALYYFEDLRLREIAAAFGVTESRICQIHAQAILNLRAFLKKHEQCPA